jgi:hypothetical protein
MTGVGPYAARAREHLKHSAQEIPASRIESALGFVLRYIREEGAVPSWGCRPPALRMAMKIAHLSWVEGSWYAPDGYRDYVTACGIDPVSGRITDYERFYQVQEAYDTARNARRAKRLARS